MKRYFAFALAATMGLVYAGMASAAPIPGIVDLTVSDYPAGASANGIAASPHNLGSFGSFRTTTLENGTTEICVFCHTPHHTNTAVAPAPLWNRINSGTYTAYGTTLGGSNITAVGSVSQACLSCHDGVTTFDTLINAPGSGGVNLAGVDKGWTIANNGTATTADHFDTGVLSGGISGGRLNIGQSLTNDHPMSVTYQADRASLRATNTVIGSIDLTAGLQASAATAFNNNLAQNRWAIKGYIDGGTATIADLLRDGKVECSSCHDPHFKNMSWDEVDSTGDITRKDGLFLRRVGGNTGSGVCRTCHNK